jgi:PhoPQ-activated pathogenicity-related protein
MFEKGLSIFLAVFLSAVAISATPLDDYVNTPDPHYKYELIYTYNDQVDYKIYILNMTSQKWKDETFVKNPIWWHYVVISVPNKVLRPDAAFMFIAGGSQESS